MTSSFRIDCVAVHLDGVGRMGTHDATADFWASMTRTEFRRGQILSAFSYTDTWDYRERHPDGDELAVVLHGSVDLLLDCGDGETPEPLEQGSGYVIPAGAWHRVHVREPCTILFITPVPARTEHEDVPRGTGADGESAASA